MALLLAAALTSVGYGTLPVAAEPVLNEFNYVTVVKPDLAWKTILIPNLKYFDVLF